MKLTRQIFLIALTVAAMIMTASAQTLRSEKDPRNTAPTVGTGGSMGGPTGLFTVYDGQTLRKGEYTFSAAYSNYDRDPGNVDITEVPVSFQFGLNDYLEFFFNADMYRAIKVNSPRNLSGFYLPNSRVQINGQMVSPGAVVLAPQGPGVSQYPGWAIFRPETAQPWALFPYIGMSTGNFGAPSSGPSALMTGPIFGFASGSIPTIGAPKKSGSASLFPGMGSIYGGILPGIVLQSVNLVSAVGTPSGSAQTIFTTAPTYLPDAPFINRVYGTNAWSTFTAGGKWRWTKPTSPIGAGVVAYYRWYADTAEDMSGFNAMQRGAGPGGNKGDIGVTLFGDARVRSWMNISANVGYHYNGSSKMDYAGNTYTMLDRPDELITAIGIDFPVDNKFQPILELRSLQYVGGRTPNAFENNPMDGLAGFRYFRSRNVSMGFAYRYHFNSQSTQSFNYDNISNIAIAGRTPVVSTPFRGIPPGFIASSDAHGFIFQMTVGGRNERKGPQVNQPANVESMTLSSREITTPCQAGYIPRQGAVCSDNTSISVSAKGTDAENDVLTYNYTVSGGRIVGQGANVTWDLSGVKPGTYTITAGVDDGCGYCGKTVTETVTVRPCDCVVACACPNLDVAGGGVVIPGQPMNFSANLSGGSGNSAVSYQWTVSAGRISGGQGTSSITVDTTGLENTSVTATVKISSPCPTQTCTTTASETGSVAKKPTAVLVDEFGALNADAVRARIDAFIVALQNNPGSQGYIINNGTAKEVAAREKLINNHLSFRKFPAGQITMVKGTTKGALSTKLYRVPAGAPTPGK